MYLTSPKFLDGFDITNCDVSGWWGNTEVCTVHSKKVMLDSLFASRHSGNDWKRTCHLQDTTSKIPLTRYHLQDTTHKIPLTRYHFQDTTFKIPLNKIRMYHLQDTTYKIPLTRYHWQDTTYKIPLSRYHLQDTTYNIPLSRYHLTTYVCTTYKIPLQDTPYKIPLTRYQISGISSWMTSKLLSLIHFKSWISTYLSSCTVYKIWQSCLMLFHSFIHIHSFTAACFLVLSSTIPCYRIHCFYILLFTAWSFTACVHIRKPVN